MRKLYIGNPERGRLREAGSWPGYLGICCVIKSATGRLWRQPRVMYIYTYIHMYIYIYRIGSHNIWSRKLNKFACQMRIKSSAGKGIFPTSPIFPPFFFLFHPLYLLYLFLIVTTGQKRICHRTRHAIQKSRRNANERSENKGICKREIPHPTIRTQRKPPTNLWWKNNKQMSTETQMKKIVQFFVVRN